MCEDLKQVCPGYQNANTLIADESRRSANIAESFYWDGAKGTAAYPTASPYGIATASRGPWSSTARRQATGDFSVVPASWADPSPVPPLSQDPMTVYVAFFLSEFTVPWDPVRRELLKWYAVVLNPYPGTVGDDHGNGGPMILAAAALAEGHFGKLQRHKGVVQQNYQTYGRALTSMTRMLSKFQQVPVEKRDGLEWRTLMMASSLLMLWEVCISVHFPC